MFSGLCPYSHSSVPRPDRVASFVADYTDVHLFGFTESHYEVRSPKSLSNTHIPPISQPYSTIFVGLTHVCWRSPTLAQAGRWQAALALLSAAPTWAVRPNAWKLRGRDLVIKGSGPHGPNGSFLKWGYPKMAG